MLTARLVTVWHRASLVYGVVLEPLLAALSELQMLLLAFLIVPGEPDRENGQQPIETTESHSDYEPLVPDLILYRDVL
jgi:hypothetical protein